MAVEGKKMFFASLLVLGVILLVMGFSEYGKAGSKLSRAVGRGPSKKAVTLLVTGGLCAAAGAYGVIKKK